MHFVLSTPFYSCLDRGKGPEGGLAGSLAHSRQSAQNAAWRSGLIYPTSARRATTDASSRSQQFEFIRTMNIPERYRSRGSLLEYHHMRALNQMIFVAVASS